MLNFRFPDRYAEDEQVSLKASLEYARHLSAIEADRNPELLTYFGVDFFHDGNVTAFIHDHAERELSFRIHTTWIADRRHEELGYLSAGFQCRFQDVMWLQCSTDALPTGQRKYFPPRSVQFVHAEVDTLDAELAHYRMKFRSYVRESDDTFHSLTIQTDFDSRIGVVFRRVVVIPDEPVAWQQLVASGHYQIPWCHPPAACLAEHQADLERQLGLTATPSTR